MSGTWTKELEERLADLALTSLSCSKISAVLSKESGRTISRNAVIGKIARLKLNVARGRPSPPTRSHPVAIRRPLVHAHIEKSAVDSVPGTGPDLVDECVTDAVSVLELQDHQCRWPVGQDLSGKHVFCGKSRIRGLSYCEDHGKRAYASIDVARKVHGYGEP